MISIPTVTVHTPGALFDGRAEIALHDYLDRVHRDVAARGADIVGTGLIRVLKHPTGYYESHIRSERAGVLTSHVWDDLVIYGPWLEGVGSRNFPVTRFRGYSTFRRAGQQLDREAGPIAERLVKGYVERMNR